MNGGLGSDIRKLKSVCRGQTLVGIKNGASYGEGTISISSYFEYLDT
ncbi:hypothetical protein DET59_11112 [Rossellomorea aquimaris]|uniref:Uncharacterized protein n=1 Tax=Rossellomorea aquimaris TaxID=189382 RepID=A0A366EN75_9BACI|nr:hypothetical protein DET59_11112 [Rossellomorea aquimaris]